MQKTGKSGTQGGGLWQEYAHALIPLGDDEKALEDEKEKEKERRRGGRSAAGEGRSETFVSALCRRLRVGGWS